MPEEAFFLRNPNPPGKFNPPQTKNGQPLNTWGGGGGGRSYGRLGLPSISATRKLSENTKKK